jgi:phosphatidylserine/phosphatidylglycerophosphate/cardiolipin synthase-like enzyme
LRTHDVQMLRTISDDGGAFSTYSTHRDDVRRSYRQGIECATDYIYLENQYFRSTQLADWIVARATARPSLIVILVVVANAAADDGTNAITEHGDHLQYSTFHRIVTGVGASRVRLYTMKNRAVHSKLAFTDDRWCNVGSANANVRSFELDSELNIAVADATLVRAFRRRLWAHNLGVSEATVAGWSTSDFLARWDAVAAANAGKAPSAMAGEGVVRFDYTAVPGAGHGSIPDAFAELDLAPDGGLFAGDRGGPEDTIQVA